MRVSIIVFTISMKTKRSNLSKKDFWKSYLRWIRPSFFKQLDSADCGPTCLKMIAAFYGKVYPLEYLREKCYISREGSSLLNLNDAAVELGFRSYMSFLAIDLLESHAPLPAVLHWNQNHFIV